MTDRGNVSRAAQPTTAIDWLARAPLPRAFYARPVLAVARDVIGKVLVHATQEGVAAGRVVEAEAYRGPQDRAAHSWRGRRTARTEVMYRTPGLTYMFLVYGMHWQFNLVTTAEGTPHAVLIRALEPIAGAGLMAARRALAAADVRLSNGPGKLCAAMGLDGNHYGADLTCGPLFLTDAGTATGRVIRSPRIGVDYAGTWAAKPWRFSEAGNRFVSRAPRPSSKR